MAVRTQCSVAGTFVYPHAQGVASLAVSLGTMLDLPARALHDLKVGAILHDVGKIGVPTALLEKHGPLTREEFAIMQQHTLLGAEMAQACELAEDVVHIIRSHHEWWDGTGYPDGLAGAHIPLLARIVAVADAYDAITSNRPYRNGMSARQAIAEIVRSSGTQFDSYLARVFVTQVVSA